MGFIASWDQISWQAAVNEAFHLAKDLFHKSESETLNNYDAWISARVWDRVADQLHLFSAFSTEPLIRLGAEMNLTKMGTIYGDI